MTIDTGSGADTITVNSSDFTNFGTASDTAVKLENITFSVTDATSSTEKTLTITTTGKNTLTIDFSSLGTTNTSGDVLKFYKASGTNQELFATINLYSIGALGDSLTNSTCNNLKFTSTTDSSNVITYSASNDLS